MNIKDKTIALIDSLKVTCQTYGMGNDGNEYKIITQVFLYKFMADKFGYELKKINDPCLKALKKSDKWEEEFAKLSKADREKVSLFLPPEVPVFKPDYLIANLWNKQAKGDFDVIFDETMVAIVIPTGSITAKSGIEHKILERIVNEHIVYGVVSMPSNVFANTGTNVSVLFFDKTRKKTDNDKVTLVDASKLGKEYKNANGLKKVRLEDDEIEKIVTTFRKVKAVEDFSVVVTYSEVKEKGYSLSAGQYFDIKIDYVDIAADEFNAQMKADTEELAAMFAESHKLEKEIQKRLSNLKFN